MSLRDDFVAVIRRKHYSLRTERTYWAWIMAFLRFHHTASGWRHPRSMGAAEIESFLSHLAVNRRVAASTQNQALNALVFLYKQVLEIDPGSFHAVRAKPSRRMPTVLSRREVHAVLAAVPAPIRPIAELMYGAGLRVRSSLDAPARSEG
jgi:site-specific recombinase XerD